VALRHTGGDAHRAQDVTQTVFTALARKAPFLCGHSVLTGWLYRSTRFAASDAVRAERRRQERTKEAQLMDEIARQAADPNWETLRPELDAALESLSARDRDAVALRFFEDQPFANIVRRLRLTENAARMRVERALEKLRARLAQKGVASTTAALAILLSSEAGAIAPTGLAASVAASATVSAAGSGGVAASITFMTLNKIQIGAVGAAVAMGAVGFSVQTDNRAALRADISGLRSHSAEVAALEIENRNLRWMAAEVAELRRDDAELLALRDEAEALRTRMRNEASPSGTAAGSMQKAQPAVMPSGFVTSPASNLPDAKPLLKVGVNPTFPAELRAAAISGEVVAEFYVDARGTVREPSVVSSTHDGFEAAALAAIRQWAFEAGRKGGRFVNTKMRVPIRFSVTENEPVVGEITVGAEPPKWF